MPALRCPYRLKYTTLMAFVYLDHNATTPVDPRVASAMEPFLTERFGNASSLHAAGRQARAGVEEARRTILAALGDPQGQLVFTSGGTEADNLAIVGAAQARAAEGRHLVVSAIEHHAALHAAQRLGQQGWSVTVIPVDAHGVIELDALRRALVPGTTLVSIMQANNEVGTIQPIAEIAALAHACGAWVHTDAVQSFGKIPVDVRALGVDLLTLSGHKLYGPKGAGALYLRRGVTITPQHIGGPHEHGLRAGTEAVAPIVGLGRAVELSVSRLVEWPAIARRRDELVAGLQARLADVRLNGHPTARVPNTANLSFLGCEGDPLLIALDLEGLCVSTGAACASGSTEPSHVLVAMRLPEAQIRGSIRCSLGLSTSAADIAYALDRIPAVVTRLRRLKAMPVAS